jgi:AAA+ ATPase superfamily predicted ATPase
LREPRNYFAILQTIAAGRTRLNEIKQATGIEGATSYLDPLQQLHLVERVIPVTEKQPQKSRRGIYRLKDQFLRFSFRTVHPNRSQLKRGGALIILENQVMPETDHFASLTFEEVCQKYCFKHRQQAWSGCDPFTGRGKYRHCARKSSRRSVKR